LSILSFLFFFCRLFPRIHFWVSFEVLRLLSFSSSLCSSVVVLLQNEAVSSLSFSPSLDCSFFSSSSCFLSSSSLSLVLGVVLSFFYGWRMALVMLAIGPLYG
jgi:hypothetical protein